MEPAPRSWLRTLEAHRTTSRDIENRPTVLERLVCWPFPSVVHNQSTPHLLLRFILCVVFLYARCSYNFQDKHERPPGSTRHSSAMRAKAISRPRAVRSGCFLSAAALCTASAPAADFGPGCKQMEIIIASRKGNWWERREGSTEGK